VRIDRLTLTNYKGFASRGFDLNPWSARSFVPLEELV